jgi:hypothetical protein
MIPLCFALNLSLSTDTSEVAVTLDSTFYSKTASNSNWPLIQEELFKRTSKQKDIHPRIKQPQEFVNEETLVLFKVQTSQP